MMTPQALTSTPKQSVAPSYRHLRLFSTEGHYLGATTAARGSHMVEVGLWERVDEHFQIVQSETQRIQVVFERPSFSGFSCTGLGPTDSESEVNTRSTWTFRKAPGKEPSSRTRKSVRGAK
jgi:hypothetical protein